MSALQPQREEMTDMKLLNKLVNGEVGTVREVSDWNEDECCIEIDNVKYKLGEEVDGIDEFLKDKNLDDLVLFRGDGYRGIMCYSGYIEVDGKEYTLDIINEYVVYEITKISEE